MRKKSEQDNIRVPTPKKNKKEIFVVLNKILGGSRMNVKFKDGKIRIKLILGSKRRRISRIKTDDLLKRKNVPPKELAIN